MTKAVIFDVGRVLFQWDLCHLFSKLISDPDDLNWFVSTVITPEWHFQSDAGRPLEEMIAERRDEFPDHAWLIDAYAQRFVETIPGPVEGMVELVEELFSLGTPLFIITNFGDEFWRDFRPTQPLFDLFSDILVSGTEKLVKPDISIYQRALDRFELTPESALFIDDMPANVTGALSIGINSHQFIDAKTTRDWLVEQSVLG